MSSASGRGRSILAGSFLIAIARGTSQFVQVAIFLASARILAPAEFGTYALVSMIAVLGSVAAQAGWAGFILSARDEADAGTEAGLDAEPAARPREGREVVGQTITLSALSGLALAVLGLVAARVVPAGLGGAAGSPVRPLVELLAVWVLLSTCAEGQSAVLLRQGRVAASAGCQIAAEVAGLVTVVWLLHAGAGVLALGCGRVAAQGTQLALAAALARAVPALRLSRPVVRRAVAFSAHMLSVRVIATLRSTLGTFVVGGFLGAEAAGFFRLAQRLVAAVYEIICEPVRTVAWVLFRRALAPRGVPPAPLSAEASQEALQRMTERLVPVILSVAAPILVGLSLVADDLFALLLGEAWRPAGPIASILAIECLLLVPATMSEPLFSVTGHVRVLPRVSLVYAAVSVGLILPSGPLGLHAVAFAHLAAAAVCLVATIWMQERTIGLRWGRIGAACLPLAPLVVGMALTVALLKHVADGWDASPSLTLAMTAVPAACLYLAALVAVRAELVGLLGRALRRS